MKAATFEYHVPRSLEEAIALRSELGDDSAILAGGQSLVPMLNLRLARPPHVIDLRAVEELGRLTVDREHMRLGAMVTQRTVERADVVARANPLLVAAIRLIGHPQTRARGTVAGSVAHADPAAELPATILALGGTVEVASRHGRREIPASELFTGFLSTSVRPDELIVGVDLPGAEPRTGTAIVEVSRTRGDFAIVGAVAIVRREPIDDRLAWRVSLFGVDATPILLTGECTSDDPDRVAAEAAAAVDPGSDVHGSAEYRRHLVRVVVQRAMRAAVSDAFGDAA